MGRLGDRNPAQHHVAKPIFAGAKNGLMTCSTVSEDGCKCDWSFFGPRDKFQAAWTAHWRERHSQEVGVVLTHRGETRLDELLAMQRRQPTIILAR